MFKIILNAINCDFCSEISIPSLNDLFAKETDKEDNVKLHFSKILDNLYEDIIVLKPIHDDFLVLYSKKSFWKLITPNFPEYMHGRYLKQIFPVFESLGLFEKFTNVYENDCNCEFLLKIYNEDTLIFKGHQNCRKYEDLLFLTTQDITNETLLNEENNGSINPEKKNYYINKYFQESKEVSSLAFSVCDKNGLEWSDEMPIILETSSEKFCSKNFNDYLKKYVVPEDQKALLNIIQSLSEYNPKISHLYRVCTEKGNIKYLRTNLKFIKDEQGYPVRFGWTFEVKEFSDVFSTKNEVLNLQDNLETIEEFSKIALVTFKNGEYTWTSEIYNILKFNPEDYERNINFLDDFILEEDKKEVYSKMQSFTPENNTASSLFRVKDTEGNLKYLNFKIVVNFDVSGNFLYSTGFIQDVTEETLAKEEALILEENFSVIQSSSKIFIGHYENGEYYFTSEIYNILGVKPEDFSKNEDIIKEHVIPEDQEIYDKLTDLSFENPDYNEIYRVKTVYGEIKYLFSQTKGIFDEDKNLIKIVGLIQDVNEETLAKEEALELKENIDAIQKYSKIVISTFQDGNYTWTDEIYNILEINSGDYPDNVNLITLFEDSMVQGEFSEKIRNVSSENPQIYQKCRIKTPMGKIKYLEWYMDSKFDENGELIKTVSFIQEITDTILREQEMKNLLDEREILLEEVHHRVKNNLQLISSFLRLDSRFYKDNPEYVIDKAQNRLDAMALTHEEIYESNNMSQINLKSLFTSVLEGFFHKNKGMYIKRHYDIESDVLVDIDQAMPLSFLLNELAYNVLDHAFPNKDNGNFYLSLKSSEDKVFLNVWDDGVGLPSNVDFNSSNSLGFIVIRRLVEQLNADIHLLDNVSGFGVKVVMSKD